MMLVLLGLEGISYLHNGGALGAALGFGLCEISIVDIDPSCQCNVSSYVPSAICKTNKLIYCSRVTFVYILKTRILPFPVKVVFKECNYEIQDTSIRNLELLTAHFHG